ncbi:MAG TPA: DUF1217 domain-containing protein, partial [Tianweitania sediminis]|nr:DUF1217 domain-containing protein [Tianweitania sediminis]
MINTYLGYQLVSRDMAKSLARVEKQPMVERDTAYYLENITKVKSIDAFMADDKLFRYAMKAHGLEDMNYAKAFMRKALEGGIDDDASFANKLTDKRYYEFVETFNFVRHGETATVFTKAQQGTVDKYVRQTLEEDQGAQNEGVRLALYFERKASEITSFYSILADGALSEVLRTTLGLPDAFATGDIDKQVAYFEQRVDIEDFQDPEKLDKFLKTFTAMWETKNPSSSAQSAMSALFAQSVEYGLSTNL